MTNLKNKKSFNVAVVGATGAVGKEMLLTLEGRNFPVKNIKLLASPRTAGKKLPFKSNEYKVEILDEKSFENIDIALFSAGGSVSEKFAPIAAKAGAVVIDNTSAFRMDKDVPLVIPEVNRHKIKDRPKNIIANPNCSTIQMVIALKPLHDFAKIKRIVVSTYQAVSGAGNRAMNELTTQLGDILNFKDPLIEIFPHQIAFNIIPQIDKFLENGYTKEEMKMINETKKIMDDHSIKVTATTVRVPVLTGHSESVNIEFHNKITREDARKILSKAEGVKVIDNPVNSIYPLPLDAAGKDDVLVGRIREDESLEHGLNIWIVADNLRKGAALNAVQIAEDLIKRDLA